MRIILFLPVLLLLVSCSNYYESPEGTRDSAEVVMKKLKATDTLNALFLIRDEKQMKEVFGNRNVTPDTLKGVEGAIYLGTKLFRGSEDELFISWNDTANRSEMSSIRLACLYDAENDIYNCESRWLTTSGVHLGTTLKHLIELNGKDFTFYGLGWDYGGTIIDWNRGRLSHENIVVTLGVDNMTDEQRKNYPKVLGDHEFSSANPSALCLDPIVLEIILSKPY